MRTYAQCVRYFLNVFYCRVSDTSLYTANVSPVYLNFSCYVSLRHTFFMPNLAKSFPDLLVKGLFHRVAFSIARGVLSVYRVL